MSDLLPIIDQMHNAADDRGRADLLLRVPDSILLTYSHVFEEACAKAGFEPGQAFINSRITLMRAVRDGDGLLPRRFSAEAEAFRIAFIRFVANGDLAISPDDPEKGPTDL
ncbi:hypothetical protein LJR231_002249 [Phyllobacterium sp. LjRoot231]|uniref:hypothetical protein n=1 Tax=Phyllobacterium sp. LjRoot231 TaxID=3342289 RepID=UPI003ECF4909